MISYNLNIYCGSSFSSVFTVVDTGGQHVDLTNLDVSGFLKNKYSDTIPAAKFTVDKLSPISGLIRVSLTPVETSALPVNISFYDIKTFCSGNVTGAFYGKVNINPTITL